MTETKANNEDQFLIRIGSNLRNLRKEKGFSQFELAIEAGLPKNQIGRIERGEINTTIISLKKITDALNITLDHFFRLDNTK